LNNSATWNTATVTFVATQASRYFVFSIIPNTYTAPQGIILKDFVVREPGPSGIITQTVCLEYDAANTTIQKWTINANAITEAIDSCIARSERERTALIEYATNILLDSVVNTYYTKNTTNCLANAIETTQYAYTNTEYHYTLYYYDQAGNLVQTVPPSGVVPLNQTQVNQVLSGTPVFPLHTLLTNYQFNSLNQSTSQTTPDAGLSQFWYNNKGQLRLSQNAQQYLENKYSYTRYDAQARIVEVGELYATAAQTLTSLKSELELIDFPQPATYVLKDVTKTYYDFGFPSIQGTFPQQYLRGRVAYVEVYEKDAINVISTYYSYDIHGNVQSLLQDVPGLGYKRTDYRYDLVSGKVNYVIYQEGQADQLIHKYTYDADNRITNVYTSVDGWLWDRDAQYQYYLHGPLARTVLGEYTGVQGLDYYYTLQGWVKGVNMPYAGDLTNDGYSTSTAPWVSRDVYAYTLGYYTNDYVPRKGSITLPDTRDKLWIRLNAQYANSTGYYNGNIAWMITDLKKIGREKGAKVKGMQAMMYKYDQLHRIVMNRSLTTYTTSGFSTRSGIKPYDEDFSYDANGNILTLQRRDGNSTPGLLDNYNYTYYPNSNKLRYLNTIVRDTTYTGNIINNNKLYRNITINSGANVANGADVTLKATTAINFDPDPVTFNPIGNAKLRMYVIGNDEGGFNYDAIGNLVWDQDKGVKIEWTPYGKVRKVSKGDGSSLTFRYDGTGNRMEKKALNGSNNGTVTRYVRDASGNVMATYTSPVTAGAEGATTLAEQPIYGSSRLGMYKGGRAATARKLGTKSFELSNHLGNVLTVITDNIRMQADSAWASVASANDFYAFGSDMPDRGYTNPNLPNTAYRYGFNGKEHDTDGGWGEASYDYGSRIYNPRYARFLSVDPLFKSSPNWTPYRFALNNPIRVLDGDGNYETDGHYWTVFLVGLTIGLDVEKARTLAFNTEKWDTEIHRNSAKQNYTWASRKHQQRTHALTGGSHEVEELTTLVDFLNSNPNDVEEMGRLLHRYGDTYAHSHLNGDGKMYGGDGYTTQHAFAVEPDGTPTGVRPDQIYERPELYKTYVGNVADLMSVKFGKSYDKSQFQVFGDLADYASRKKVSLIGIINYEVAKKLGENSFVIQFAKGYLPGYDAHLDHIKNTKEYLDEKGVKYKVEQQWKKSLFGGKVKAGYQGVKFTIQK
jgi:RHS repeat-associated protein